MKSRSDVKSVTTLLSLSDFLKHDRNTHATLRESLRGNYACDVCDFVGTSNDNLRKHIIQLHFDENSHNQASNTQFGKPCYFFNKGTCRFSSTSCKFIHKSMPKCRFQQNCRRERCMFVHEPERKQAL